MSNQDLSTVEDAVVKALQTQLGAQVQTLETYQGDWSADLKRKSWRLPAVLVKLRQSRALQVTAGSYDLTLDFIILVVVRQLRGEADGRRQPDGAYELLVQIRQALCNQDLGLDLLPFSLVREEPLLNTPENVVFAAHYQTAAIQDF